MSIKPVNPINMVNKISQSDPLRNATVNSNNKGEERQKEGKQLPARITRQDATAITEVMNKIAELCNHQLHFEVFEETDQVYVQVVDKETKEVIKQIPPQELLELSAKIREMVGIILDTYV